MAECEQLYDLKIVYGDTVKMKHVKKLRKKLYALKQSEKAVFVHGIGRKRAWKPSKIICPGSKNTIIKYISAADATVIPRQTTTPLL